MLAAFVILAILLGLAGPALMIWALFGDRSRVPRCRRCWYSMEGAPDLTCPECSWQASSETILTRRRRRPRSAVIGLVLLVVGAGALVSGVHQTGGGWWSLLPNRALIMVARRAPDRQGPLRELLRRWNGGSLIMSETYGRTLTRSILHDWAAAWPADATRVGVDRHGVGGLSGTEHVLLMAAVRDQPHMALDVARELLESDDPRLHAAALCFLCDVGDRYSALWNESHQSRLIVSQQAGTSPINERGWTLIRPPTIPRSAYDTKTAMLIADRVVEGRTTVRPYYALEFFVDLDPIDDQLLERMVRAAARSEGIRPHAEVSGMALHRGSEGANLLTRWLEHEEPIFRYFAALTIGLSARLQYFDALHELASERRADIEPLLVDPHPCVAAVARWARDVLDQRVFPYHLAPAWREVEGP